MTDTNRHDKPADRRASRRAQHALKRQAQKVHDGQGQLQLFSQFPDPDVRRSNQRGSFLRRPRP